MGGAAVTAVSTELPVTVQCEEVGAISTEALPLPHPSPFLKWPPSAWGAGSAAEAAAGLLGSWPSPLGRPVEGLPPPASIL